MQLTQNEFRTNHDCEGKVIYKEFCRRLKFEQSIKWYSIYHLIECTSQNQSYRKKWIWDFETQLQLEFWDTHASGSLGYKCIWDFEIQTDHLITVRSPDLTRKKKRTCHQVDFTIPAFIMFRSGSNLRRLFVMFSLSYKVKCWIENWLLCNAILQWYSIQY